MRVLINHMPFYSLTNPLLYKILLGLFLFLTLWLLFAFLRERRIRKKPYFKDKLNQVPGTLAELTKPLYSIALIGDIGAITTATDPLMGLVQKWMDFAGEAGSIVLLGDNIYPKGLPPESDPKFTASKNILDTQIEVFNQYSGRIIYLSGNHDWNKGRRNGYSYVLRQQEYLTKALNKNDSYLPLHGCPGPVTFSLAPGLRIIVINTQWWVQRGIRPIGKAYGCTIEVIDEFFQALENILTKYQHEQIIIAAHHPLYSNAQHGGNFTLKQHLFPLTAAHKRFYLPLPVAGSLYPAYRKVFGAYEDMSHPRYRNMRKKLLKLFKNYNNLIYVAGHDHNLQYFPVKGNHYIVSGAGSKTAFVEKGGKAAFTHEHKGFFVIDYYENQEVWLRVLEPTGLLTNQKEIVFQKKLN